MDNLPRLIPIAVPWSISPSVPFLRLAFSESERRAVIEFVAFYARHNTRADNSAAQGVQFVSPPGEFQLRSDELAVSHRLVRLVLQEVVAFRVLPEFAENQPIDESAYDWSAVAGGWRAGESVFEWTNRTHQEWLETGICPTPGVYMVSGSSWSEELLEEPYRQAYQHYLLCGNEDAIDVIARSIEWLEGQPAE